MARGWTLVELLVVLALVGASAAWGVPSFREFVQSRAVWAASDQYVLRFAQAKQWALERREVLHWRVEPGAGGVAGCYIVYSGASQACSCSGSTATCGTSAELLAHETLPIELNMTANGSGRVQIEPWRQLVTPSLTVQMTLGPHRVRHLTNIMGRTRRCHVGGDNLGLPAC